MNYDPLNALMIFIAGMIIILIIVWPEWGLWFRFKRSMKNNKRIMMEDALKEIYEGERNEQDSTVKSLAGSLAVSSDQITSVLKLLSEMELIKFVEKGFRLTDSGREYALRVIRIHRLWEQYFAEKTGVPEASWHNEADKKEHETNEEQMNEINHLLGYPKYDPHGDPIPTETGELPPSEGISLTDYRESHPAVIIHIEDEPKSIYSEIINSNINIGMTLEKISEENNQITISIEGRTISLSKMAALNITVRDERGKEKIEEAPENLSMLNVGEQGEVLFISKVCRGPQRRRLMDLGILPGTVVRAEMKGIGGDPTAFKIRGANIALRRDTAKMIHINKLEKVA
jgi:DtxR family transcriptional regulator, Mn-dependent transcriptional regulator